MRRLLLAALLLLAVPTTASATLNETPPVKIGVRSDCVQTTGETAEVLAATKKGPVLLHGTHEGFKVAATPAFSGQDVGECPAASIAASGAGVIACCRYSYQLAAAVREPGGAW